MKRWLGMALVLGAACAVLVCAQEVDTLEGFSVPEFNKNGEMTSQLFGDFAEFLPGGLVKISNLKIEFYDEKKDEVEMRVKAPKCEYYEREKKAESDSSVRIERKKMVVTGVGFTWYSKDERLEIRNNAKVVLKDARKHVDAGETQ